MVCSCAMCVNHIYTPSHTYMVFIWLGDLGDIGMVNMCVCGPDGVPGDMGNIGCVLARWCTRGHVGHWDGIYVCVGQMVCRRTCGTLG